MASYVLRRILVTIPVMAIVAFFVFSLLYIAPGDPAAVIAGDQASPADVERIRQSLGLDRPFLVQFGSWLWRTLHLDLHQPSGDVDDLAADRADAVVDDADARSDARHRHTARRGRGLESRQSDRPHHHGLCRFRLLAAGLCGRICPGLCLRARTRMAAGTGVHADLAGFLAVAAKPDPARHCAWLRLHRADRARHACLHA